MKGFLKQGQRCTITDSFTVNGQQITLENVPGFWNAFMCPSSMVRKLKPENGCYCCILKTEVAKKYIEQQKNL
jgi:hypothetical protein